VPHDSTTATNAAAIPITSHADGPGLLGAGMTAMSEQLDGLDASDWSKETDCTEWDVRAMVAHLVATAQEQVRPSLTVTRMLRGRRHYRQRAALDARNQIQIDDLAAYDGPTLRARYRELTPKAVAGVRRNPAPLRALNVPSGLPGVPKLQLGYLFDVICLRDIWMHGVDIAWATGRPRVVGPADVPAIEQVVRDLGREWSGPAVRLTVHGALDASWILGQGDITAELAADAVELCRSLAGRPADQQPALLSGDPTALRTLQQFRVLF
jgi:uncharacterized protein (TIGR03083 family)